MALLKHNTRVNLRYTGPVWMKQTLSPRARAVAGPVLTTKKQWVEIDAKKEKGEGFLWEDE
jgi:hypothetical protein